MLLSVVRAREIEKQEQCRGQGATIGDCGGGLLVWEHPLVRGDPVAESPVAVSVSERLRNRWCRLGRKSASGAPEALR
jgi:hypothetical protein